MTMPTLNFYPKARKILESRQLERRRIWKTVGLVALITASFFLAVAAGVFLAWIFVRLMGSELEEKDHLTDAKSPVIISTGSAKGRSVENRGFEMTKQGMEAAGRLAVEFKKDRSAPRYLVAFLARKAAIGRALDAEGFLNEVVLVDDMKALAVPCRMCGKKAIVPLTKKQRAAQPDETTHVCHMALKGCNHGFAATSGAQ